MKSRHWNAKKARVHAKCVDLDAILAQKEKQRMMRRNDLVNFRLCSRESDMEKGMRMELGKDIDIHGIGEDLNCSWKSKIRR